MSENPIQPQAVGITAFVPGTPEYDVLISNVTEKKKRESKIAPGPQALSRLYYDTLAEVYNRTPMDGLVRLNPPSLTQNANLIALLQARGLEINVDFQLLMPTVDASGHPLKLKVRPRYMRRMTLTPMRQVLRKKSPAAIERMGKFLKNAINERQARLGLLVNQLPHLKVVTPQAMQKVEEWLKSDHQQDSPIEALLDDIKAESTREEMRAIDKVRQQAAQEALQLQSLGLLQTKLNAQVGGEVVFLEPGVAK